MELDAADASESSIHEASLGSDGAVVRGVEIDEALASAHRLSGGDVVVCGPNLAENRRLAARIGGSVGPAKRHEPHVRRAGPRALPHFQQDDPPPEGHTFYETPRRKARRS